MRRCEHDNPSVEYKLGPICIHEEHGPMEGSLDGPMEGSLDGFACSVCEWRVCGCGRAAVDGDTRCDACVADDEACGLLEPCRCRCRECGALEACDCESDDERPSARDCGV